MRTLSLSLIIMLTLSIHCFGSEHVSSDNFKFKADSVNIDSVEHHLIIMELGYQSYLVTQPPMEFYSESYYRTWNRLYIMEWNNRYKMGPRQELYENEIFYDEFANYGIELEYQLYYFFLFFEDKYKVHLIRRGTTSSLQLFRVLPEQWNDFP